ncbi:MAG: pilus assembly protein TadG-related protein [Anaerolineae bacterium]
MKIGWSSERGQYLAQFVILLPLLLGFMGLVIDLGNAYAHQRMAQNAADAAASAGGMVLYGQGAAAAETQARYYAGLHGYSGKQVEIGWPSQCIRVVVTEQVQPIFVAMVWNGTFTVRGTAQACYRMTGVAASVLVLDPHACEALELSGNALMRVRKGNVHVNSDCSTAITLSGSSRLVTELPTTYVGGYRLSGASSIMPLPVRGNVLADPLAGVPIPEGCYRCLIKDEIEIFSKYPVTLPPGCYMGGLSIGANAQVLLRPGLYCIGGDGLKIGSGAQVAGSSVTLFLAENSVTMSGGGRLSISPPTSGPYAGIVIYQARRNYSTMRVTGGASLEGSRGIVYLPDGTLDAGGGTGIHTNLVVRRLEISGGSGVDVEGYAGAGWGTVTDALTE